MSKYITIEGVTFKKADLKRLEQYSNGDTLYVVVAGKKDPICIKCGIEEIPKRRASILTEVEG